MAIIRFTLADKLKGKTLDKGIYRAEVTEFDGPKASSSQKSLSTWTKFTITEGPYAGKVLQAVFNTETENPSLLGALKFLPQTYLFRLAAAIQGIKYDDLQPNMELDTETLLHKPFDLVVNVQTVNGDLINEVVSFLPVGSAQVVPF
jgi:hypothetical protein